MVLNHQNLRSCSGAAFNSGVSVCTFEPGKVKALILAQHGVSLPATLTAENLEVACHADRPARIYPIKTIVNYEPNGGEAQTSDLGYRGTKPNGYSAKSETWTLENYDENLRAAIANAKGANFDLYLVDDNNVIFGMNDGSDNFVGIPLSGISFGGQSFATADAEATLTITTYYKDFEDYVKNAALVQADFDVVDALNGLVFVELMEASTGKYKLVEHYSRTDITAYYATALVAAAAAALGISGTATYDATDNVLNLSGTPTLAAPSVLQANDVIGIEAW